MKEILVRWLMSKDLYYADLYALYGALLSESRADVLDMYYDLDLSLSEIADQKGVTRQSVADSLKNARLKLDRLEGVLSLYKLKNDLKSFADELDGEKKKKLLNILEK